MQITLNISLPSLSRYIYIYIYIKMCPALRGNMHTDVRAHARALYLNVLRVIIPTVSYCVDETTHHTQAQHTCTHTHSFSSRGKWGMYVCMCMSARFPVSRILSLTRKWCALVAANRARVCHQEAKPIKHMIGTVSLTRKGCALLAANGARMRLQEEKGMSFVPLSKTIRYGMYTGERRRLSH